jgi:hypothetical protein
MISSGGTEAEFLKVFASFPSHPDCVTSQRSVASKNKRLAKL